MGVSGCGKSSVGQLLAKEMEITFIDADDHHPQSNIDKMSRGIPLTDEDRGPWLDQLNQLAKNNLTNGCVIACSALKQSYREQLSQSISKEVMWVYLKGDYELIYNRMKKRSSHFMEPDMLRSQFETLEEPKDAIVLNIEGSTENVVQELLEFFKKR